MLTKPEIEIPKPATVQLPMKPEVSGQSSGDLGPGVIDFSRRPSQSSRMKYRVVIEPDEDGVFVAECPALPGCISQGMTRTEALANIKDAMTGYLASLKKYDEPVPPPISEEIVEIPA